MVTEEDQKKAMARIGSKFALQLFKRDTLMQLVDEGALRSAQQLSFGMDFLPQLIGQAEYDFNRKSRAVFEISEFVETAVSRCEQSHKNSILKEKKRKNDAEMAKKKKERDEAEAKRKRKQKRNALREAYKLANMTEQIKNDFLANAVRADMTPAVRICDVRDYQQDAPAGVHLLGGFAAELLFTLTSLYDWLQSNPAMSEFRFTAEAVEKFVTELIMKDDFAEGTLVI